MAAMATEGLKDMSEHFLPRWCSWGRDRMSRSMIREGREVRSCTDYILRTYRRLFGMHNSDNYMVLGCLHSAPLREHARYLRGR